MQERRVCVTQTQSHKKHHCIITNRGLKDARVESLLEQLTWESLQHHTARGNEVKLDVYAREFWEAGQISFFNVRVFNLSTTRYVKLEPSKSYKINEKEKKRYYNERLMQIEDGSLTPLVLSVTEGMSRKCLKFSACLPEIISKKRGVN